jgi:hypothetical protein
MDYWFAICTKLVIIVNPSFLKKKTKTEKKKNKKEEEE